MPSEESKEHNGDCLVTANEAYVQITNQPLVRSSVMLQGDPQASPFPDFPCSTRSDHQFARSNLPTGVHHLYLLFCYIFGGRAREGQRVAFSA